MHVYIFQFKSFSLHSSVKTSNHVQYKVIYKYLCKRQLDILLLSVVPSNYSAILKNGFQIWKLKGFLRSYKF